VAKAGILEVADVFVVNKSDREGADAAVRDLQAMIRTGPELAWAPPVVRTAAASSEGVDELWEAIQSHRAFLTETGDLEVRRRLRLFSEVEGLAVEHLRVRVAELLADDEELAADLAERRIDPYRAAARLERRVAEAHAGEGARA
jgi:LAO/AO transport system kinase